MGDDEPDISELAEKAKIVAEATGREEADVMADLLDDGIVNMSNEGEKPKDLVTQLKEAAELITTVQAINQEVSENKVLNGGENSTEVKVETTLEGDIVDRAIESIQRKTENIKKMIITMTPIFLLLTGGGLEALGIIDVMDSDEDDWENDYYEVWGCTAPDADNYMPDATHDDGSCWWDDNNGGGGGPPHQNCDWRWDDTSYTNDEAPDILYVLASFSSPQCPHEMHGDFSMGLVKDGQFLMSEEDYGMKFYENQDLGHQFIDLEPGTYRLEFHFHNYETNSDWNWQSPRTYVIEESMECDAFLQNQNVFLDDKDEEQNAVTITVDVAILSEIGNACDSHQFELTWRLYIDNQVQYEEHSWEDGWISDNDRADFTSFTIDNVAVGTYDPRIILKLDGDTVINEVWISETITIAEQTVFGCTDLEATNYDESANEDDGSCEYPEPEDPCDVEIHNHYRGHVADDAEQDAILVAFRVVPSNCEGDMVEIDIELYQNGYDANYTHWLEVNGDDEYTDVSHIFDGVAIGNSWTPRITATLNDEQLEQVLFWGIDVLEQEPETCEINLFDIELATNNTTATVGFDLDCGYEVNDLDGYNVSVQFLVYHLNETNQGGNGTGPIEWTTELYYIQGYADDVRVMVLNNFTVENITNYDFYWYAIWEDADGNQQYIEQTWMNREI
jgi:hypothetical protein